MTVATAFAVSWNPLTNSNPNATARREHQHGAGIDTGERLEHVSPWRATRAVSRGGLYSTAVFHRRHPGTIWTAPHSISLQ